MKLYKFALKHNLPILISAIVCSELFCIMFSLVYANNVTHITRIFFAYNILNTVLLIMSIFVVGMAIRLFSFQYSRTKADFFCSIPYTRKNMFISYMLAIFTYSVTIVLISSILIAITCPLILKNFVVIFDFYISSIVKMLLTYLLIAAISMFATCICCNIRHALATVLVLTFGLRTILTCFLGSYYSQIILHKNSILNPCINPIIDAILSTDMVEQYAIPKLCSFSLVCVYTLILILIYTAAAFFAFKVRKSEYATAKGAPALPYIIVRFITISTILLTVYSADMTDDPSFVYSWILFWGLLLTCLYDAIFTGKLIHKIHYPVLMISLIILYSAAYNSSKRLDDKYDFNRMYHNYDDDFTYNNESINGYSTVFYYSYDPDEEYLYSEEEITSYAEEKYAGLYVKPSKHIEQLIQELYTAYKEACEREQDPATATGVHPVYMSIRVKCDDKTHIIPLMINKPGEHYHKNDEDNPYFDKYMEIKNYFNDNVTTLANNIAYPEINYKKSSIVYGDKLLPTSIYKTFLSEASDTFDYSAGANSLMLYFFKNNHAYDYDIKLDPAKYPKTCKEFMTEYYKADSSEIKKGIKALKENNPYRIVIDDKEDNLYDVSDIKPEDLIRMIENPNPTDKSVFAKVFIDVYKNNDFYIQITIPFIYTP